MTIWSGDTLEKSLGSLVKPFDKKNIDCSAYTLSVGDEVYITPNHEHEAPTTHTKAKLSNKGDGFSIPPGQFGFIVTEEEVKIPEYMMAFISMKSKNAKFRGLINVSGFHVDPGYQGKLMFSVFNAGPQPIQLERGMGLFLIWYAELDKASTKYIKKGKGLSGISATTVSNIPGEIHSYYSLDKQMNEFKEKNHEILSDFKDKNHELLSDFKEKTSERMKAIEIKQGSIDAKTTIYNALIITLLGVLAAAIWTYVYDTGSKQAKPEPVTVETQVSEQKLEEKIKSILLELEKSQIGSESFEKTEQKNQTLEDAQTLNAKEEEQISESSTPNQKAGNIEEGNEVLSTSETVKEKTGELQDKITE